MTQKRSLFDFLFFILVSNNKQYNAKVMKRDTCYHHYALGIMLLFRNVTKKKDLMNRVILYSGGG